MCTPIPRGLLPLSLALVLAACGDDSTPAPGGFSSTGPGGSGPTDAGAGGQGPTRRSLRPTDDISRLPEAEAELEVALGGAAAVHRIEVEADLGALDVHFSIDTSASIVAEINTLQQDLEEVVIAELRERVPDVSFGVSRFEDFPASPYGSPGEIAGESTVPADTPFELLAPITADVDRIESAVATLDRPLGFGGDRPESGAEALYQIATGEGYRAGGDQIIEEFDPPREPVPEGEGTLGGVGFRQGALHVVMHVTDAPSHEPDDYRNDFPNTHSLEDAAEALAEIDGRVIGIVSGLCPEDGGAGDGDGDSGGGGDSDGDGIDLAECRGVPADDPSYLRAREQLEALAVATGATGPPTDGECPHGLEGAPLPPSDDDLCPFVFDVAANGVGLSTTVVDSVVGLVNGVRFERVTAEATVDPLGFVERIVPVLVEQTDDSIESPMPADLLPEDMPDGQEESFVEVRAKARLGFDVHLRNTRITPTDAEQRFRLVVTVMGDGLIIAQPTLRVVVPPGPPTPLLDEDAGAP